MSESPSEVVIDDCYMWQGRSVAGPYPLEVRRMAVKAIRMFGDATKPPYLPDISGSSKIHLGS